MNKQQGFMLIVVVVLTPCFNVVVVIIVVIVAIAVFVASVYGCYCASEYFLKGKGKLL